MNNRKGSQRKLTRSKANETNKKKLRLQTQQLSLILMANKIKKAVVLASRSKLHQVALIWLARLKPLRKIIGSLSQACRQSVRSQTCCTIWTSSTTAWASNFLHRVKRINRLWAPCQTLKILVTFTKWLIGWVYQQCRPTVTSKKKLVIEDQHKAHKNATSTKDNCKRNVMSLRNA